MNKKIASLIATEIVVNTEIYTETPNGCVKKTIWQRFNEDGKPVVPGIVPQAKKANSEKIVMEILAAVRGKSQKGDISQALADQGFFDGGPKPKGLADRDPQVSGKNPVDVKKDFFKQNPN